MIATYAAPSTKLLRFDMLMVGDQFRTHQDGWLLTKKSATTATRNFLNSRGVTVKLTPATTVVALMRGVAR